jgi:hypothetical protein
MRVVNMKTCGLTTSYVKPRIYADHHSYTAFRSAFTSSGRTSHICTIQTRPTSFSSVFEA